MNAVYQAGTSTVSIKVPLIKEHQDAWADAEFFFLPRPIHAFRCLGARNCRSGTNISAYATVNPAAPYGIPARTQ